jgi:hypothetical protein
MEKYTKWRDAGTGIAPFLPVAPPDLTPVTAPLRVLLAIIKAPLLCFYLLFFLLADSLLRLALGLIHPPSFHALRSAWARGLLFMLGFWQIPVAYEARGRRKPLRGGDLLISNWSSPVDILLIVYLVPRAMFVQCSNEREMLFKSRSAFEMCWEALRAPLPDPSKKGDSLAELRREYKDRVLVVFPEGTTTNNRGLLAFGPIIADDAHVLSIRYGTPACLSTPIPNIAAFFWACCSILKHEVRLKGSGTPVLQGDWEETLARLARIPRTKLAKNDKTAFLKAWQRR